MKLSISKEFLLDDLQKILGPTSTKQNSPILNSILIVSQKGKVKFTATDLDTTIISSRKSQISEPGSVVVPMKRFISIARELPPKEITLETTKNSLWIKCEKIEFKINTYPPEEFPQVKEEKETSLVKLLTTNLEEMIRLTAFCVGGEDTSYALSGILFEIFKDKINLVSTDGKRLAFIQKTLPPNQPEIKTQISFILPLRAVQELYKLIKEEDEEEVYLSIKENRVGVSLGDTQFIARPIEGEFPDYRQYLPAATKDKLVVERRTLLFALRRASLFSTTDHQGVKLELKKDSLVMYKNTPQFGEVKEVVDVQYSGAALEIGFNPNYLVDVLKNMEDSGVSIEFFGPDKPAVLRRKDYTYLLLPLKL